MSSKITLRVWPVFFLLLGAVVGKLRLDPLVDTKQGLIKGLRADDGDYSMFLGIPYGKVDADNPFGVAQPHPKFQGVFEAFDDSKICPQIEQLSKKLGGTLDCLRLNIFVPNRAKNKIPVIVWIHGGSFKFGSGARSNYGPKYLIRHDVIVVSINYRLGPYGFMCLDIPEVSGNQGLKDQTMALRWINDNIEAFGGDANKITVYGVSSGSACVEYHIASRNEKLFNQAILGSGSIYGRWAVEGVDNTVPIKIAKRLGFETEDNREALAFLKNSDVKLVTAAADEIKFTGCIEKRVTADAFLTENPMTTIITPKARNMTILTGFNSNELMLSFVTHPADYFKNIDPFKKYINQIGFVGDKAADAYKMIRRFYIGDLPISEHVKWELDNFNSDVTFIYPIKKSLERFQASGAKIIYHYLFAYNGERNLVKVRLNITEGGAAHADELGYVFDIRELNKEVNPADQIVIDRVTAMWTNFVKFGNPTPERSELLPVQWPAVAKDSINYLYIGEDLFTSSKLFFYRLSFWDLFFEIYREEMLNSNKKLSYVDVALD